jgi:DNA processing protein
LIKQGAKLVESAQDVLDELEYHFPVQTITPQQLDSGGALPEHPVLAHLGFDPQGMDTLAERSGLTVEALSAMLLQLELEGRVAVLPGGLYQRTA